MDKFKEKYEVERLVASGAFSPVYLSREKKTGTPCAVKFIRNVATNSPVPTPRVQEHYFKNESKILKLIQNNPHPYICNIKELLEDDEGMLVVQEFVSNGTLFEWVSRVEHKKNREEKVRKMFWKILCAVDHLHNNLWIVHRDIKLENIMLDNNKDPKVIDFNLSTRWSKDKVISTEFCGSLLYCPPELLRKKSYSGPPQDVWSLGVLLYVMLFSIFPFGPEEKREEELGREESTNGKGKETQLFLFEEEEEGEEEETQKKREQERQETKEEIIKKIIEGKFSVPSSSSLVINILRSVLVVNPRKRPTITELKAHPWFERERREEERGRRGSWMGTKEKLNWKMEKKRSIL